MAGELYTQKKVLLGGKGSLGQIVKSLLCLTKKCKVLLDFWLFGLEGCYHLNQENDKDIH